MNANRGFTINLAAAAVLLAAAGSVPAIGAGPAGDAAEGAPTTVAQAAAPAAFDGRSWRARGDELLQAGRRLEALEAYRRAEQLGAGDELLTMDIAEIYRQLGRDRDAYWEFHKNRRAADRELRASACYGMNALQDAKYKSLPAPYFADLGVYAGWQSADDLAYAAARGRLGMVFGEALPTSLYLFGQASRDTRSRMVGSFPRQFSDNLAIVGVGVQQSLAPALGLRFVGEAGRAHDLANFEPKRERTDLRAGLEMWQEWNVVPFCESTGRHPLRFVMTAWAELMYYSRYSDATVFNADLRPGLRLRETGQGALDVLVIFVTSFDSKAADRFQYGEAGLGLRWIPDHRSPFRVTVRAVQTFDAHGRSGPKYGIELEHYWAW